MDKLYSILAKWLADNTNAPCGNEEIYKYGIQTCFEQGAFIVTSITMALLINSLGAMLLFLLVFFLVRPFIGGIHLKKISHCYCLSVISSVGIVLLAKYLGMPTLISASVSFSLICVTCLILLSQSKQLEQKEYLYYRKKLVINLTVIVTIILSLLVLKAEQEITIVAYTLLLTSLSFLLEIKKKGKV